MFTNQSYYKAGNLETIHFLTKLNILLKTFCLFFLCMCLKSEKKIEWCMFSLILSRMYGGTYVTICSSMGTYYVKEAELGHSHFFRLVAYGNWAELGI